MVVVVEVNANALLMLAAATMERMVNLMMKMLMFDLSTLLLQVVRESN